MDRTRYAVVINHEEQYSIWPATRDLDLGWKRLPKQGTKEECIEYIEKVWTDRRPTSIRRKIEEDLRRHRR